jgi:hypothetical protein
MHPRRFAGFGLVILAAALFSTRALTAQTTATTGVLFGVVSDGEGKTLPGVTVSITSPALQGTRTFTTGNAGEYNFPLLPPGTYRIEANLSGFEPQVRAAIVVSLNKVTRINVTMTLSRVTEEVTVSASSAVVDPTQTNMQVNLKDDFLKYVSIGQATRDYQDAMEIIPGVADQTGAGGNPSVFGSNLGQNSYQVDGLNTTDPVTHTFGLNFGFDAIQEIAVQTGGFEAEYGRAVGGVLNVITKSGGNRFSGTFDIRYTSQDFQQQGSRIADYPPGTTRLANDKNLLDFRVLQPEGSVGGPILKDEVWFFADALRNMNRNQPQNVAGFEPQPDLRYGWNLFGKITATPWTSQTLTFRYTNSYQDNRGAPNTVADQRFISPEAGAMQYQKTEIYNLGYDAVLTNRLIANLQGGITNSYLNTIPMSQSQTAIGSIDQVTGIVSNNFPNFQEGNRDRNQVLGSTTYYLEALGSHAIKVGADLEWTKFNSVNNSTGTDLLDPSFCSEQFGQPAGAVCGSTLLPADGSPFFYLVSTNLPKQTFKGQGMAFFAQDEWRPLPNLTLKAGVRYDQQTYYDDLDQNVLVLNRFQPRIGIAWDIFKNAETVFRVQGGQFQDDLGLNIPAYLSTVGSVGSYFRYSTSQQRYIFQFSTGGPTGNTIDPSIVAPYTNFFNAGVTQHVFKNTSVDLAYVYREGRNIIEDSCVSQSNCPGPFWLTNAPAGDSNWLRSDYHGVLLTIQSRLSSKMSLLASYVYSKSRGSLEYTQNAGADFDVFPDHFINRYGYLSDDARSRIKLDGYYRFPWEITLGTHFYWDSGVPYNVTTTNTPNAGYGVQFLEPRGSRRLPDYYQWDALVQKDFLVGPVRLGIIGSVFNILNTEIPVARNGSVGSTDLSNPNNPQFNYNIDYQRPRRFEVGFRAEF